MLVAPQLRSWRWGRPSLGVLSASTRRRSPEILPSAQRCYKRCIEHGIHFSPSYFYWEDTVTTKFCSFGVLRTIALTAVVGLDTNYSTGETEPVVTSIVIKLSAMPSCA